MTTETRTIEGWEVFPDGTLKLSCLMKHMQQAGMDDIANEGASYERMLADDMVFVIIRMAGRFISPIRKGDTVEIQTRNTGLRGIFFVREFKIIRDGEPVAFVTTYWVLMSFSKRIPLRPSKLDYAECKGKYENQAPDDAVDCGEKTKLPDNFTITGKHTVMLSELDENRHMNNTVYGDLVYDYCGAGILNKTKSFRINFNGEAFIRDTLDISVSDFDGGYYMSCINERTGKSCFDAKINFEE